MNSSRAYWSPTWTQASEILPSRVCMTTEDCHVCERPFAVGSSSGPRVARWQPSTGRHREQSIDLRPLHDLVGLPLFGWQLHLL